MTSSIVVTSKRHFLAQKHVVWAIKRENRSNGSTWPQDGEKRKGQDRTQKVTYLGEAPTEPIFTKICTVVAVPNLITCANFWAEIFRSYDFTGVEFPVFLLILSWALHQCSATALPVIARYWSKSADSNLPHLYLIWLEFHEDFSTRKPEFLGYRVVLLMWS